MNLNNPPYPSLKHGWPHRYKNETLIRFTDTQSLSTEDRTVHCFTGLKVEVKFKPKRNKLKMFIWISLFRVLFVWAGLAARKTCSRILRASNRRKQIFTDQTMYIVLFGRLERMYCQHAETPFSYTRFKVYKLNRVNPSLRTTRKSPPTPNIKETSKSINWKQPRNHKCYGNHFQPDPIKTMEYFSSKNVKKNVNQKSNQKNKSKSKKKQKKCKKNEKNKKYKSKGKRNI